MPLSLALTMLKYIKKRKKLSDSFLYYVVLYYSWQPAHRLLRLRSPGRSQGVPAKDVTQDLTKLEILRDLDSIQNA